MKRTSLKSSSLKFTTALAVTALMGGAAFAGPDNPKEDTEDATPNAERIVIEEKTTLDTTVIPNDAPDADTQDAENLDATWSEDTTEEAVIELPDSEEDVLELKAGDIVIDSPDPVIISNPDEVIEADTSEDLAPEE